MSIWFSRLAYARLPLFSTQWLTWWNESLMNLGGMNHSIPDLLHYLDDYITAGPTDSQQCLCNLNKVKAVCSRLGLPLHPCVGPVSCMVVLIKVIKYIQCSK